MSLNQADRQWLAEQFEFEVCEDCGFGVDKHTVARDGLGKRRYLCTDPIPASMPEAQAEALLAQRTATSTK